VSTPFAEWIRVGTPGHELVSGGLDVRDGVSGTRRRRHGTDAGARRLDVRDA
jgi:hypothetical protein